MCARHHRCILAKEGSMQSHATIERSPIERRPIERGPLQRRPDDIAAPEPSGWLAADIRALPASQCLYASGEHRVFVAHRQEMPSIMREIGRLREISFRAVQEGTGKSLDIDAFDDIYQQLFVWHDPTAQVLGAYRLCMTDLVLRTLGREALYTTTLFHYDERFLDALGPALELGRSFVRPEYQRAGRVLALLWKGIGQLLAARPRYRTLFGPVSISAAYSEEARRLIAARLCSGSYRHPLSGKVRPRRPIPAPSTSLDELDAAPAALSRRISELEPDRKGLPILVREYLKLGGQFLSFSVDPAFQRAMDGLVAVDLDRTKPRLLALYLGEQSHAHFRRFQRLPAPAAGLPPAL